MKLAWDKFRWAITFCLVLYFALEFRVWLVIAISIFAVTLFPGKRMWILAAQPLALVLSELNVHYSIEVTRSWPFEIAHLWGLGAYLLLTYSFLNKTKSLHWVWLLGLLAGLYIWIAVFGPTSSALVVFYALLGKSFWVIALDSVELRSNSQYNKINLYSPASVISRVGIPTSLLQKTAIPEDVSWSEVQKSGLQMLVVCWLSRTAMYILVNLLTEREWHRVFENRSLESLGRDRILDRLVEVLGGHNPISFILACLVAAAFSGIFVSTIIGYAVAVTRMFGFALPSNNSNPWRFRYFHEFLQTIFFYYGLFLKALFLAPTIRWFKREFKTDNVIIPTFLSFFIGSSIIQFVKNESALILILKWDEIFERFSGTLVYFLILSLLIVGSIHLKRIRRNRPVQTKPLLQVPIKLLIIGVYGAFVAFRFATYYQGDQFMKVLEKNGFLDLIKF
jgi:hypothetical protein